jgi:hypothetical protein
MSHNKQQRRVNEDHHNPDDYANLDDEMHQNPDNLVNNSIRNRSTKNNNQRGAHSEKPNKRQNNAMINNQPLYSIAKPPHYLEEEAKEGTVAHH